MAGILRGSVHWAELNPVRGHEQAGTRPVVIVSQNVFNERSGTVIGMAITSQPQKAGFPLTLELSRPLHKKQAWVKISQVRTLSTDRIGAKLGEVTAEELEMLVEGLNEIIAG